MGKVGAIIVAHDNVRKRLSTEQFVKAFNARTPAQPNEALPVVTFSADTTFHLNGDEINFSMCPRRTRMAIRSCISAKQRHPHGDCYFNGFYPFIDTSSGGHPDGMDFRPRSRAGAGRRQRKIIPGHGSVSTKATLKANRDMLATVWGRVQKLAKEGKIAG